jgi:pimeloyl-ACP methyl ester carboxylesterase
MLRKGKHFQSIIHRGQSPTTPNEGAEEVKFFDVASFDPRGINNTTPVFSCFDDEIMSQTWDIQGQTVGLLGSSNTSFEQIWSRSTAFAQRCATHPSAFANPMGQHIGQYINTSPVIRDMVEIVEKHGEWRELDVAKQLSSSSWSRGSELYRAAVRRGAWKKGQEKLLYWGLSYGTFVGQAFASMQPHRIGRMLLDGVMDADDYTQNLGATELLDTEKALKALFVQCVEAGEASCPWASNNTCENMALQLDSLLSALMVTPLPASGPRGPTIITHSDLATMIFNNIYAPMEGFPIIASIISDLLQGNGTFFAAYKEQSIPIKYPPLPDVQPWSQRSTADAILCADGDSLYNESRITFQSRLTALRAQSPLLADVLAPIRLSCLHWPIRPVSFASSVC